MLLHARRSIYMFYCECMWVCEESRSRETGATRKTGATGSTRRQGPCPKKEGLLDIMSSATTIMGGPGSGHRHPPVIHVQLVMVHRYLNQPFLMHNMVEWFGEKIHRVFNSWDVVYIDKVLVDRVTNETSTNVDMLHMGMGLWVVGACECSLIVAI